jgi:hypothetical protein
MIRMAIIAWPCIHYGGAERWWYYVCANSEEIQRFRIMW